MLVAGCGHDTKSGQHSTEQLRDALLTVSDVSFVPAEWEENMRAVVDAPTPPWEDILDPYLCSEADVPEALTRSQAQLELTGGSVMEILLSVGDAEDLYSELKAAYDACGAGTSLVYQAEPSIASVGDESASYRSDLGVVTIARFGSDLMILKWWVGDFYDQVSQYLDQLVTAAADKVENLPDR